jgi:hypothetical protein
MAEKPQTPRSRSAGRQIIGFSLSRDLAADVKLEAARRKVALKTLFVEMWALYKNSGKKRE